MKPRVVLSSIDDSQRGLEIARTWVEQRLVACVQLVPGVKSVYRWQGATQVDDELTMILKFACADDELEGRIERLRADHPYDEPEFVSLEVDRTSKGYGDWLSEVCGGSDTE